MRRWGSFWLALIVALIYALMGFYYLLPSVYHPLTADTVLHTTPHLTYAAIFWALAGIAIILGRFARPAGRD